MLLPWKCGSLSMAVMRSLKHIGLDVNVPLKFKARPVFPDCAIWGRAHRKEKGKSELTDWMKLLPLSLPKRTNRRCHSRDSVRSLGKASWEWCKTCASVSTATAMLIPLAAAMLMAASSSLVSPCGCKAYLFLGAQLPDLESCHPSMFSSPLLHALFRGCYLMVKVKFCTLDEVLVHCRDKQLAHIHTWWQFGGLSNSLTCFSWECERKLENIGRKSGKAFKLNTERPGNWTCNLQQKRWFYIIVSWF